MNDTTTNTPPICIVVGMGKDTRAIGNENGLLWHVPDDLKRFKKKTLGHPIIMGRKTFESILSILGKPLPNRTTIVVTRNPDFHYDGILIASSFENALEQARALDPDEIHIGGGAELYKEALPLVTHLFVTEYHDDTPGDTYFPPFKDAFTEVARHGLREHDGLVYEWVDYVRAQ